jgi:hypothetical protein
MAISSASVIEKPPPFGKFTCVGFALGRLTGFPSGGNDRQSIFERA